jgi:threonine synthase
MIVSGNVHRVPGVFAEPAAATSVAAAKSLSDSGVIGRDDTVVCDLTGHGLEQPDAIRISHEEFTPISPSLQALRSHIVAATLIRY